MRQWMPCGVLISRVDNRWATFVDGKLAKTFPAFCDAIAWAYAHGVA